MTSNGDEERRINIHISLGETVNIGDYESVKVDVGVSLSEVLPRVADVHTLPARVRALSNLVGPEVARLKDRFLHRHVKRELERREQSGKVANYYEFSPGAAEDG